MATTGAAPIPGVAMGERAQVAGRAWNQATQAGNGLPSTPPAPRPATPVAPAAPAAPAGPIGRRVAERS